MGYVGKVTAGGSTHLVGSTLYGTCATGASTAAKVVTCSDFSTLLSGVTIHVKFTYSNTAASPTLNVNSTGAKTIYRYGTTAPGTTEAESWQAGAVVSFTYDGTNWVMNDYQAGGGTGFVRYDEWQGLTNAQRRLARQNIDATAQSVYHLYSNEGSEHYTDTPQGPFDVLDSSGSPINTKILIRDVFDHYDHPILRFGRDEDSMESENAECEEYQYVHGTWEFLDPTDPYAVANLGEDSWAKGTVVFRTSSVLSGTPVIKTVTVVCYYLSDYLDDTSTEVTYSVSPNVSTNVSVAANAWSLQATPTYSDFPYRAAISLSGVTSGMYPEVVFAPSEALSGNYAPVASTGTNTVYIYANAEGAVAITIPSVIVR